mgnify:CR=1 FL=1
MYSDIVISGLVMLGLDAAYLSLIKEPYLQQIENIQLTKPSVKMIGVFLSYAFMIFGINYFILQKKASLLDAFLFGLASIDELLIQISSSYSSSSKSDGSSFKFQIRKSGSDNA